ncbi:MAG: 16S rRNA (cytidine(1402)-2'-O)-methyltransferase [Fimbriimonas sp.]|nr:16S rRNA (cytidine(1402)-2'-O)-methyltransferase [Fimbriimonas sp.]
MNDPESGKLMLVATPIGNLGDLSPRAVEALGEAEFWLVEDSRVSGKLASHLGLKKPMKVLNEHTSPGQMDRYLVELKRGARAALLTDGGSPSISDPGAILTDRCHDAGVAVDGVPGPSAVIDALMLSGFFAQRFAFLGFLGRKPGAIRGELTAFADSPLTLVLFESPHRLDAMLKVAHEALGNRRYAVCRELTKLHQQIYRSILPDVPSETEVPRRGEITLIIEGRRRQSED